MTGVTIPDPDGRIRELMTEIGKLLKDGPVTGFGTGRILYPQVGPGRQYYDDLPQDGLPFVVKEPT